MVSDFRKKRNAFLSGTSKIILGVLIFSVMASLMVASTKIYKRGEKFSAQIENLRNEIKELKEKNSYLKEAISKTNDSDYIEKVAREELNLQKPGEQAVSFIEGEQEKEIQESKKSFFHNWLGWLTGLFGE